MMARLNYTLLGIAYVLWAAWLMQVFPALPETIPVHFNAAGEPDGWGKRGMIWVLPLVSLGTTFMVLVVPRLVPELINYPVKVDDSNRAAQQRLVMRFMAVISWFTMALFIYISWMTVRTAMDGIPPSGSGVGIWVLMGLMFGWIGLYVFRSRQAR
jgi:uncharacterized membrane protein